METKHYFKFDNDISKERCIVRQYRCKYVKSHSTQCVLKEKKKQLKKMLSSLRLINLPRNVGNSVLVRSRHGFRQHHLNYSQSAKSENATNLSRKKTFLYTAFWGATVLGFGYYVKHEKDLGTFQFLSHSRICESQILLF